MKKTAENIKMIVCDIDNTIIPAGHDAISRRLATDFHKAMEKGIRVVLNTGRHYTFLQESLFDDLPLDLIGTINGACVVKRDGTIIECHQMSEQNMNTITDICTANDIGLGFKFADAIVTYANHEKFVDGYVGKGSVNYNKVIDDTKNRTYHLNHGYPLGTFLIGDETIIEPFNQIIPDLKLIPNISKTDISRSERKAFKDFAIKHKDLIDMFAKGEIDFKKFCEDLKGEKTTNTD